MTGQPLLANDMHLGMTIPAIWYEIIFVLSSGTCRNYFFGYSGIVVGHSQHVAWVYCNGFPDVQDLYMENLRRTENGSVQYEVKTIGTMPR
jgi:penicillin amidase